jgi:putative ABC transport system substrate-binding protein
MRFNRILPSVVVCIIAVAFFVFTERADARPRIGVLDLSSSQGVAERIAAFVEGLRQLGYVEGRNIDIDYRYADGDNKRLEPLARELIKNNPDVLLAPVPSSARVLRSLAPSLPIVCVTLSDASMPELAASYSRPGGNVTGVAQSVEGLTAKLVELTVELLPGTTRIGFLSNPAGASMRLFAQNVADGASALGVTVTTEEVGTRDAIAPAFERLIKAQSQAVIVPVNALFLTNRALIAYLGLARHLPVIVGTRDYVEAGGLASYGVDGKENYRRGAVYVDKILKGAKPADLPIEFPTKIELVINLRTATAFGLSIPPALTIRADEVIE